MLAYVRQVLADSVSCKTGIQGREEPQRQGATRSGAYGDPCPYMRTDPRILTWGRTFGGPMPPKHRKIWPLRISSGCVGDRTGLRGEPRRRWRARDDLGVAPFVVRTGVIWSGHSRL